MSLMPKFARYTKKLWKVFYTNFGVQSFSASCPKYTENFPKLVDKNLRKRLDISGSFSDDFEKHRLPSYDTLGCIK